MLLSFAAATLDIATDGLAAQHFYEQSLVWANAFQVTGVMCGMLLGGGGMMLLTAHYGYQAAILTLMVISALCILPVLFWREPPFTENRRQKATLRRFFSVAGRRELLFVALFVASGGSVIFALMKLILIDQSWDLVQVGIVAGGGASLLVLIGSLLAGLMLSRMSLLRVLFCGLLSILAACLLWLMFTSGTLSLRSVYVWLACGVGSTGIGVVSVCSFSIFMSHARLGNQHATDFSVCQSVQTLGSIMFSSVGTAASQWGGYSVGVGFSVLLTLLAMCMIFLKRGAFDRLKSENQKPP
jgi:PAT family beta-lactamase induction signal transducer AmpG